ncbi:MAG: tetratricopeptide repeat protein [Deltaproteobacteria bacterium]|nr:tetratricopeptide repeat protein [Deltaproteobacteria bacterium]MCB9787302.1 tetratricopeptide repeat protein [Deltaproteobacteria bacterium]
MEQPRWSLATAYEDAGRFDEAVAEFRELVALKPDYCVAFLHLGSCLIELEAYAEAITALESAHRLAIAQGHMAPKQEAEMLMEQAREEL